MQDGSPSFGPRQSTARPPSEWENDLGDAIEAAFADGCCDLADLVSRLNDSGVRPRDRSAWTAETFAAAMRELGASP